MGSLMNRSQITSSKISVRRGDHAEYHNQHHHRGCFTRLHSVASVSRLAAALLFIDAAAVNKRSSAPGMQVSLDGYWGCAYVESSENVESRP